MLRVLLTTITLVTFGANAQACGSYEGRLILEDVADEYVRDDHADDVGHTEFRLLSEYTYIDCRGNRYTVPPYRTLNDERVPTIVNGASIPPNVWSFVGGPWSGRYRNAAVIHDFLTETRFSSSDVTHRIFYDAMVTSETPMWKANLMYYAVLKGGSTWSEGSPFAATPDKGILTDQDLEIAKEIFQNGEFSPEDVEALVDR